MGRSTWIRFRVIGPCWSPPSPLPCGLRPHDRAVADAEAEPPVADPGAAAPIVADPGRRARRPGPDPSGDGPDLRRRANALARPRLVPGAGRRARGLVPAAPPIGTVVDDLDPRPGRRSRRGVHDGSALDGFERRSARGDRHRRQAWLKEGGGQLAEEPGRRRRLRRGVHDAVADRPDDRVRRALGGLVAAGTATEERDPGEGTTTRTPRAPRSRRPASRPAPSTRGSRSTAAISSSFVVAGTWDVDGAPTPVTLRIDVTRVNDRANSVRPPV